MVGIPSPVQTLEIIERNPPAEVGVLNILKDSARLLSSAKDMSSGRSDRVRCDNTWSRAATHSSRVGSLKDYWSGNLDLMPSELADEIPRIRHERFTGGVAG